MSHLDKWKHGGVGYLVQVIVGLINPVLGLFVVGVLAWLKEDRYDKQLGKGVKDGWDAYATLMGALPGQLTLFVIFHFVPLDLLPFAVPYWSWSWTC